MKAMLIAAVGATVMLSLVATAEAAPYTIDGFSHAHVTANWYTPLELMWSQSDGTQVLDATVTGGVNATLTESASPPGKLLNYDDGTSIAVSPLTGGLNIYGPSGLQGHLQFTLSGLALSPSGSVLLDYSQGRLLSPPPVDLPMAMGLPTLSYQFTSPQGDTLDGGGAFLWRYSPSVLFWSRLTDSAVGQGDEYINQSMSVALSIPDISFSNGTGRHFGTLELIVEPTWQATLHAPVPEPASWALALAGLLLLTGWIEAGTSRQKGAGASIGQRPAYAELNSTSSAPTDAPHTACQRSPPGVGPDACGQQLTGMQHGIPRAALQFVHEVQAACQQCRFPRGPQ